jgi:hypothetical protein
MFLIGLASLTAQEIKQPSAWGLIFNSNNLLNLESYQAQAGIGIKYRTDDNSAFRFLVDAFYSNSLDTFSSTLGVAYERHFMRGQVSPYWGGLIQGGYLSQTTKTDSDNWTKNGSFLVSGGLVLGVEFYITGNVSLFAEYGVLLNGTIINTTTSVAGTETKTGPTFNYSIDTGLGNDAKLGIIIYLDNSEKKGKK